MSLKIITRVAAISGIVLVIFAAFSAFITYELIEIQNAGYVIPSRYIQFDVLASMLPYLLGAVIAFVILRGRCERANWHRSGNDAGEDSKT